MRGSVATSSRIGASWRHRGDHVGHLAPSWRQSWTTWGHLGGIQGHPGRSDGSRGGPSRARGGRQGKPLPEGEDTSCSDAQKRGRMLAFVPRRIRSAGVQRETLRGAFASWGCPLRLPGGSPTGCPGVPRGSLWFLGDGLLRVAVHEMCVALHCVARARAPDPRV
eukprot:304905-Pyramimonas_sp.AAC.1